LLLAPGLQEMLMPPDLMIPAVATVVIVVIVAGTLYSLLKMYMKGGGGARTTPADLKEIRDGLARMEQAIDAIAIEVERLSEGQRFTARLLAEEGREAVQIPSAIREG
jgi:hypothetical protein